MTEVIIEEKKLKITNVTSLWEDVKPQITKSIEEKSMLNINFQQLENTDGAGFQLLVYFHNLSREYPENIKLSGIPEDIQKTLEKDK